MTKKVTFEDPASRRFGLFADSEHVKQQIERWVSEDQEKLVLLTKQYGIQDGPMMFYQLALALARQIYPVSKKRGRKEKWNVLRKMVLVVEVERRVRPGDKSHGIQWACKQLAKREPWVSLVEKKEQGTLGPDPAEALRQVYLAFRTDKFANVARDAFEMWKYEDKVEEWESFAEDCVRNPLGK